MNTKTNLLSAIATAVAALTLTTATYGQLKPTADDGIAASPKVRQMLNERKASAAPVAAMLAMTCNKCADVRSVTLSPNAKGAEVMTGAQQVTYSHGCASCETKLTVAGEGKAKHQVATHKCSMEVAGSAGCGGSK